MANKNEPDVKSIYDYRKSVFVSDMYAGTFVVFLAFLLVIIMKLNNVFAYLLIFSNLILSFIASYLLKKEKYILAVYANLFVSIVLVTLGIIAFGSSTNAQIFFVSLSLSAFIYTANQRINQIFFIVHIILFVAFSIFEVPPIFELANSQVVAIKTTIFILFGVSFIYKGILIFNLYIKSESAIQKENLIYQTLFNNAYEGIVSVHTDPVKQSQQETSNQQLFKLFNDPNFSIQQISNYFPSKQPNGSLSIDYYNEVQKRLKNTDRIEYGFTFTTSQKKFLHTKITVVKLKDAFETIIIYLFKDITTEVENQKTISTQLNELNEKNTQLTEYIENSLQFENFAHLASHDLKTPTRSLVSFSQLLERRNKNQLDGESKEFLSFIKSSARKINFIINDLSEYAKIATSKKVISKIAFPVFLTTIIEETKATFKDVNIKFQLISLPKHLNADERQLKILFCNLLTNAIQFRQIKSTPKVKVEYEEKKLAHQFTVQDNGIGIEKAYLKDIFVIFKKLNASDNSNNTGIGLATCQKIIQAHQGKIWAQSQLNKGTTFYFTISKNL